MSAVVAQIRAAEVLVDHLQEEQEQMEQLTQVVVEVVELEDLQDQVVY